MTALHVARDGERASRKQPEMSNHGRYHLKECANDCGYLFVAWSNGSKYCNRCDGWPTHSRVCKVDGKKTDFAVLVDLAQDVVARMAKKLNENDG